MDWLVKTFQSETRAAFGFLLDQGFAVSAEPASDSRRRPAATTVRFVAREVRIETVLSLGFAGEDAVRTTVLTTDGSTRLGPRPPKDHEMRKILGSHADEVQRLLGRR